MRHTWAMKKRREKKRENFCEKILSTRTRDFCIDSCHVVRHTQPLTRLRSERHVARFARIAIILGIASRTWYDGACRSVCEERLNVVFIDNPSSSSLRLSLDASLKCNARECSSAHRAKSQPSVSFSSGKTRTAFLRP